MSNNVIFQLELDIKELKRVNEGLRVKISQLEKELQSKIAQEQEAKSVVGQSLPPQTIQKGLEALNPKDAEPSWKKNKKSQEMRYNK